MLNNIKIGQNIFDDILLLELSWHFLNISCADSEAVVDAD